MESYGLMTSCSVCGSPNVRTGQNRERVEPPAFGTGPGTRIRLVEYRCTRCGHAEWAETDGETEAKDPQGK